MRNELDACAVITVLRGVIPYQSDLNGSPKWSEMFVAYQIWSREAVPTFEIHSSLLSTPCTVVLGITFRPLYVVEFYYYGLMFL